LNISFITKSFIFPGSCNTENSFVYEDKQHEEFDKFFYSISKSVCRLYSSRTLTDESYNNIYTEWMRTAKHNDSTKHSPIQLNHPKNITLNININNTYSVNNVYKNVIKPKYNDLFRDPQNKTRLSFYGGTGFLLAPDILICCRHRTLTRESGLDYELHHCIYSFNPHSLDILSLANDKTVGITLPMLGCDDFNVLNRILQQNILEHNINPDYIDDYSDINLYRMGHVKNTKNICIFLPVIHTYNNNNFIISLGYDGPLNQGNAQDELNRIYGEGRVNQADLKATFMGFKGLNVSFGLEKNIINDTDPYRIKAQYSSWNGHSGGPVLSHTKIVDFYYFNENERCESLKKNEITFAPFCGVHTGRVTDVNSREPVNTAIKTDSDSFILLYHRYVWPVLYNYMINDWNITIENLPLEFRTWFDITYIRYQQLLIRMTVIINEEAINGNHICLSRPNPINKINIQSKFCCF
jgi:hypothetical protein